MARINTEVDVTIDVDPDEFESSDLIDEIVDRIKNPSILAGRIIKKKDMTNLLSALGFSTNLSIEIKTIRDERKLDVIKEYWDKYSPEELEARLK